jgi:prevent-host-death family protein
MIKVSASNLRNNLFEYLDRVSQGESIVIERNKQEIGRLMPLRNTNWRNKMSHKLVLKTTPDDLILPLEETWEDYT